MIESDDGHATGAAYPGGGRREAIGIPHPIRQTRATLNVGSTPVDVVAHETDTPGLTYVNVHNDERTAVEAGLVVIGRHGGRVFELQHGGVRNITFSIDGTTYVFDPNRMFTEAGVRKTLSDLGRFSEAALQSVCAFAEEVLASFDLDRRGAVVTLHNTMSGLFSAESYRAGGEYAQDVAAVAVHDGADPFDFFFVTEGAVHEALAAAGFNSVLQDNERTRDDGSLSIRAAREGLAYANAEARLGHLEAQIDMLLFVRTLLDGRAGS